MRSTEPCRRTPNMGHITHFAECARTAPRSAFWQRCRPTSLKPLQVPVIQWCELAEMPSVRVILGGRPETAPVTRPDPELMRRLPSHSGASTLAVEPRGRTKASTRQRMRTSPWQGRRSRHDDARRCRDDPEQATATLAHDHIACAGDRSRPLLCPGRDRQDSRGRRMIWNGSQLSGPPWERWASRELPSGPGDRRGIGDQWAQEAPCAAPSR